jgi:hypothetical protein
MGSNSCSVDSMCGTNYHLSSGDVIVLQTLFKYSNNIVKFHLPDSFRFYEQMRLFFFVVDGLMQRCELLLVMYGEIYKGCAIV